MPQIQSVEVNLSNQGVRLPRSSVGMVIAQPCLRLSETEPYQCTDEFRSQQLNVIAETLRVARETPHGAPKTHFTLFPEYSIPGPTGVGLVGNILHSNDWPCGTIVIGGTDGLSKADFVSLVREPNSHFDATYNNLNSITDNEWINCGITWVKGNNGKIERWLQPKLYPAWPEQDVTSNNMFRGKSVFVFKGDYDTGTQYRFCSLVCFDWIATVESQKPWRAVVDWLSEQATALQAELSLSWLFVIQHNRKPSATSFLTEVRAFFDQNIAENVHRERTCLVFANSAGKSKPGRIQHNGNTSLLFSGQTLFKEPKCYATFCNGGPRFRNNDLLEGHIDLLFREGGACIHSFQQVNPGSLSAGASSRTIALINPFVHSLSGPQDPRTPADSVPASVKWLNDELDDTKSLESKYPDVLLASKVDSIHHRVLSEFRKIPDASIKNFMKLAAQGSLAKYADQWDHVERKAVRHLAHTLNIAGLCSEDFVVGGKSFHATLSIGKLNVDLVAIRGDTHELCREHFQKLIPVGRNPVLLVSRDPDNNERLERFGNILRPRTTQPLADRDITDPGSPTCQLGYRDLLDIFRHSSTVEEAKRRLNDNFID